MSQIESTLDAQSPVQSEEISSSSQMETLVDDLHLSDTDSECSTPSDEEYDADDENDQIRRPSKSTTTTLTVPEGYHLAVVPPGTIHMTIPEDLMKRVMEMEPLRAQGLNPVHQTPSGDKTQAAAIGGLIGGAVINSVVDNVIDGVGGRISKHKTAHTTGTEAFGIQNSSVEAIPMAVDTSDTNCDQGEMLSQKAFSGDLRELLKIPGRIRRLEWNTTGTAGTVLFELEVRPFGLTQSVTNPYGTFASNTPLTFYANFYKFWRGTIHFDVEVICSRFHQGTLYLVWFPSNSDNPGYSQARGLNGISLDIGTQTTRTRFTIPYAASCDWMAVQDDRTNSSVRAEGFPSANGRFEIFIQNPLVVNSDSISTVVDVNVEVSVGDDFEFYVPQSSPVGQGYSDGMYVLYPGRLNALEPPTQSRLEEIPEGDETQGIIGNVISGITGRSDSRATTAPPPMGVQLSSTGRQSNTANSVSSQHTPWTHLSEMPTTDAPIRTVDTEGVVNQEYIFETALTFTQTAVANEIVYSVPLPRVLYQDFFAVTGLAKYHAFIRSDFEVTLKVPDTSFHCGQIGMAFLPTITDTDRSNAHPTLGSFGAVSQQLDSSMRVLPHVILNPAGETTAKMIVPYSHIMRLLNTHAIYDAGRSYTNIEDIGTLVLFMYNPLRVGTGASQTLAGTLSIRAINPYVAVKYAPQDPVPTSGTLRSRIPGDEEQGMDYISKVHQLQDAGALKITEDDCNDIGTDQQHIWHSSVGAVAKDSTLYYQKFLGQTKQESRQGAYSQVYWVYVWNQQNPHDSSLKKRTTMPGDVTQSADGNETLPSTGVSEEIAEEHPAVPADTIQPDDPTWNNGHMNLYSVCSRQDVILVEARELTPPFSGTIYRGPACLMGNIRAMSLPFTFWSGSIDYQITAVVGMTEPIVLGSTLLPESAGPDADGIAVWRAVTEPWDDAEDAIRAFSFQATALWQPGRDPMKRVTAYQYTQTPILLVSHTGPAPDETFSVQADCRSRSGIVELSAITSPYVGPTTRFQIMLSHNMSDDFRLYYPRLMPLSVLSLTPPEDPVGADGVDQRLEKTPQDQLDGLEGRIASLLESTKTVRKGLKTVKKVIGDQVQMMQPEKDNGQEDFLSTKSSVEPATLEADQLPSDFSRPTTAADLQSEGDEEDEEDGLVDLEDCSAQEKPTGKLPPSDDGLFARLIRKFRQVVGSVSGGILGIVDYLRKAPHRILNGILDMMGDGIKQKLTARYDQIYPAWSWMITITKSIVTTSWLTRQIYKYAQGQMSTTDVVCNLALLFSTDLPRGIMGTVSRFLETVATGGGETSTELDDDEDIMQGADPIQLSGDIVGALGTVLFGAAGISLAPYFGSLSTSLKLSLVRDSVNTLGNVIRKTFSYVVSYFLDGPDNLTFREAKEKIRTLEEPAADLYATYYEYRKQGYFTGQALNVETGMSHEQPATVLARCSVMCQQLQPALGVTGSHAHLRRWCTDVEETFKAFKKGQLSGATRMEPVGIYIAGPSGSGKSYLSSAVLPEIILQKLGFVDSRADAKKQSYGMPTDPEARFCDGYWGQQWAYRDEFGATSDGKEFGQVLSWISTAPSGTTQASLEEKGQMMVSPFICCNSNVYTLENKVLKEPSALLRRFPVAVTVEARPEFSTGAAGWEKFSMEKYDTALKACLDSDNPAQAELELGNKVWKIHTLNLENGRKVREITFEQLINSIVTIYLKKSLLNLSTMVTRHQIQHTSVARPTFAKDGSLDKIELKNAFDGDGAQAKTGAYVVAYGATRVPRQLGATLEDYFAVGNKDTQSRIVICYRDNLTEAVAHMKRTTNDWRNTLLIYLGPQSSELKAAVGDIPYECFTKKSEELDVRVYLERYKRTVDRDVSLMEEFTEVELPRTIPEQEAPGNLGGDEEKIWNDFHKLLSEGVDDDALEYDAQRKKWELFVINNLNLTPNDLPPILEAIQKEYNFCYYTETSSFSIGLLKMRRKEPRKAELLMQGLAMRFACRWTGPLPLARRVVKESPRGPEVIFEKEFFGGLGRRHVYLQKIEMGSPQELHLAHTFNERWHRQPVPGRIRAAAWRGLRAYMWMKDYHSGKIALFFTIVFMLVCWGCWKVATAMMKRLVDLILNFFLPKDEEQSYAHGVTKKAAQRGDKQQMINSKIRNGMMEVLIEDEFYAHAIAVDSTHVLTNLHVLQKMGGLNAKFGLDNGTYMIRQRVMDFRRLRFNGEDTDAVVIKLSTALTGIRKSLSQFATDEEVHKVANGKILAVALRTDYVERYGGDYIAAVCTGDYVKGEKSCYNLSFKVEKPTLAGMCGLPYEANGRVLGIHAVGNRGRGEGRIGISTTEQIAEAIEAMKQPLDGIHVETKPIEGDRNEACDGHECLGTVVGPTGQRVRIDFARGTDFVPSPLRDRDLWPDDHEPTQKSTQILVKQANKYDNLSNCTPPTTDEEAYVLKHWKLILDKFPNRETGLIDDDLCLNGYDPWNLNGVKVETSAGYWNMITSGKRGLLAVTYPDGEKLVEFLNDERAHPVLGVSFQTYLADRVKLAEEAQRIEHSYWVTSLKDELRPSSKVALGKTRVFECPPFDFNYLLGKYLGAFMVWYRQHAGVVFHHAIGTDPEAMWGEWYDLLREGGKEQGFALDYTNFDGSVPPAAHSHFEKVVRMYYKGAPEMENNVRDVLMEEIRNTNQIIGDQVYRTNSGNKSGQRLTDVYNSIVNSWGIKIAHYRLCKEFWKLPPVPADFHRDCSMLTYGDDLIANVTAPAGVWFNAATIGNVLKELGFKPTPADKKGELTTQLQPLEERTFLKRGFCLKKHVVLGPMPRETSYRELNWIRRQNRDDVLIMHQMIHDAARFMAHRGPEEYEQFCDEVKKRCRETPVLRMHPPDLESWDDFENSIWWKQYEQRYRKSFWNLSYNQFIQGTDYNWCSPEIGVASDD